MQNAETRVQLQRPPNCREDFLMSAKQEMSDSDSPLRNVVRWVERTQADRARRIAAVKTGTHPKEYTKAKLLFDLKQDA